MDTNILKVEAMTKLELLAWTPLSFACGGHPLLVLHTQSLSSQHFKVVFVGQAYLEL